MTARVAVLCPTYKRQHLLPCLLRQFAAQTYPQQLMTLHIFDDSPDPWTPDTTLPANVDYHHQPDKRTLCAKRQLMHDRLRDDVDIIVNFDSDDYQFPDRVKHSVQALCKTPKKHQIAGNSCMLVYDTSTDGLYRIGPFGVYHAGQGTMAFTLKYARSHRFVQTADDCAEETAFTNRFTEPLIQLNPYCTIICVNHGQNSVAKNMFLSPKNKLAGGMKKLVANKNDVDELFVTRASSDESSDGERNRVSVTVSVTSTPRRLHRLHETLTSIKNQTFWPRRVQVNIPRISRRYPHEAFCEEDFTTMRAIFDNTNIECVVHRCDDYGPITKLWPTLMTARTKYVMTIDDDIAYPMEIIEELFMAAEGRPGAAVGVSGFIIDKQTQQLMPCNRQAFVHVLEGYAGVLYPREAFDAVSFEEYLSKTCFINDDCMFSDDIIISNYLAQRRVLKMQVYNETVNRRKFWKTGCVLTRGNDIDALHMGADGFTTSNNLRYAKVLEYLQDRSYLHF